MAIGDRIPKKLGQSVLNTTAVTLYTGQIGYRTQVLQIFVANTNTTTARYVKLMAYGTGVGNVLIQNLELPAKGSAVIDTKLVVLASETISALQDTGTDVTVTVLGIEEQIA
ncbi:hypothetical protein [Desulfosporosinus fructosivorans]